VNSYATVWLNGRQVGAHAGGLTTFTIDVTDAVRYGAANLLAVRADDPRHIQDLPWVSGDDSDVLGFAEGSQPLGIFRPVHVIQTAALRVEPFGVDVWCGATTSEQSADLHV
jgi:beta-galactosidase